MIEVKTRTEGGDKIESVLRRITEGRNQGVKRITLGYHDGRYPDGRPVASIAVAHEFGAKDNPKARLPERRFLRNANENIKDDLTDKLRKVVKPTEMTLRKDDAQDLADWMVGKVEESLDRITPPPSERTLAEREGPGDKALLDSGILRDSVDTRIVGG